MVLPSTELVKRIQRLTTDHGHELGLRRPAKAPDLKDGDVLAAEGDAENGNAVVVQVLPTACLLYTSRCV